MTPFEKLLAIADGEVLEMARIMIGKRELALLIANAAISATSLELSPKIVATICEITPDGARKKIDNSAVRELSHQAGLSSVN